MNFQLGYLPRARRDIRSVLDYIAERSPEGARRWWDTFRAAAARATSNPRQFPFAPESSLTDQELRQFLFKTRGGSRYRAIFAIIGDEVVIVRVRGPGQGPLTEDELFPD